jgi:toxin ParE1/3/4
MRLELSRRAQADLDDIRDFSLERFGAVRAIAYIDAIEQAFRRILGYPEIGEPYQTSQVPIRSLACQRHHIFYSIEDGVVLVVRILHGAMDAERHL